VPPLNTHHKLSIVHNGTLKREAALEVGLGTPLATRLAWKTGFTGTTGAYGVRGSSARPRWRGKPLTLKPNFRILKLGEYPIVSTRIVRV